MVYGYVRCSTNENTQDITRQFRELAILGVKKENIWPRKECSKRNGRLQKDI